MVPDGTNSLKFKRRISQRIFASSEERLWFFHLAVPSWEVISFPDPYFLTNVLSICHIHEQLGLLL
jgi:hypothetical protein